MGTIIERFNERVLQDSERSLAALRAFSEAVREGRIMEINAGTETYLRPGFLTAAEREQLDRDLSELFDLMVTVPERFFNGNVEAMCDAIGLSPVEKAAVLATWRDQDVMMGRADLFRTETGFKLLEVNVHSSTGGIENSDLNRAMLRSPFYAEFLEQERLSYTDTVDGIAQAVRQAARQRGMGDRPTLVVAEWNTAFAQYERSLRRISALFTERGFDAFPCSVQELTERDGILYHGGRRVDILYRIFVLDDLVSSPSDIEPILAAHRAGNLLLAMGFVAELLGTKATLACLSDPANRDRFTQQEQALIDRLIPQTRHLKPGMTTWKGEQVDLLEMLLACQQEVVIKPVNGYGGQGVVTGWSVSPVDWQDAVNRALSGPVPYVVQERVRPVPEPMPCLTQEGIRFEQVVVNWGVFYACGRFNGILIRGVPAEGHSVINASRGAAHGCAFVGTNDHAIRRIPPLT